MATRAIRYNKLNFGNTNQATDALHWIRYRHNDMKMRTPLQEACIHGITHAGDSAQDIQQNLNDMMNQLTHVNNYYQVIHQVYGHLIPYLIHIEMQNHGLDSFMRKKLTEMRDYAKANATQHPHYGHVHFEGHTDQDYMGMFNALRKDMDKVASSVNAKYFPSKIYNNGYNRAGIVQVSMNYNIINPETTDEHIENWVNIQTGNYFHHLWRQNAYYFFREVMGRRTLTFTHKSLLM